MIRPLLLLAVLLLITVGHHPSECLRVSLLSKTRRTSISPLGKSMKNGKSQHQQLDETKKRRNISYQERPKTNRRRRRRNADFPSFMCDIRSIETRVGPRQKVLVRPPSTAERTGNLSDNELKRGARARTVIVPQRNRKRLNVVENLLVNVFGTSSTADPDVSVNRSARKTRLLNERAYARREPFAAENITVPPSLDDLASFPRKPFEEYWINRAFQLLTFFAAYCSFPYITKFLDHFVTMPPGQLDDITSNFAPGISILYGTFISLTLSILYERQRDIQDNVAVECSLLVTVTRNLLSLLKDDPERAIEAGQCAADQVRTLVRSSRGAELMLLMYSDPYARMLEVVDRHEEELHRKQFETEQAAATAAANAAAAAAAQGAISSKAAAASAAAEAAAAARARVAPSSSRINNIRDILKDLNKVRASRLSDEGVALPPTHYVILNCLTLLILLGYSISILPTVSASGGVPSNESSLLFGFLTVIYVLFYNFASDLNDPFRGVYQVRRSCAATHLLEAKWLIANHPVLAGQVDFEEQQAEEESAGVLIRSPGLGDLWFEREDIYVDHNNISRNNEEDDDNNGNIVAHDTQVEDVAAPPPEPATAYTYNGEAMITTKRREGTPPSSVIMSHDVPGHFLE